MVRRVTGWGFARAIVLLIAASLGQGCGEAQERSGAQEAHPGAAVQPSIEKYLAAAREVIVRLGEPGTRDNLPASTDPAFKQYIEQANALTTVLGSPRYPVQVGTMDTICGPTARVTSSYLTAGLNEVVTKQTPPAQAIELTTKLSIENMEKYFDQIFPLVVFNIHCSAVHVPAIEGFVSQIPPGELTEVRRKGVRQVRNGLFNTFVGGLTIASDPALDEARRTLLLEVLARDAALAVPALPSGSRLKLIEILSSVPTGQGAKSYVATIMSELTKQGCGLLCSM